VELDDWRRAGQAMKLALPPLPESASRLVTDDLDEVRTFVDRIDGPHSRVAHGVGPFGYDGTVAVGRDVGVARVSHALGQTVRGSVLEPTVQMAFAGGRRYRMGRNQVELPSGGIVFIPRCEPVTVTSSAGDYLALQVDSELIQRELDGLSGRQGRQHALRLRTFALSSNRARAFQERIAAWVHALAKRTDDPSGQCLRAQESAIAAWVATLHDPWELERPISARTMRRAAVVEEWIDAHLNEPITLGRLCALAGVGRRRLQQVFDARRGTTPLDFVAQRRLVAAHRRLRSAAGHESVTAIALDCGFTHMGRFSVAYRQTFGETPSATLRGR
jgi:AraC-like DNA-binding protein